MSHPDYISGLPKTEYYRQYKEKNNEKIDAYQCEYRKKNREYFREKAKDWRKKNPNKTRLHRSKKRAMKANARLQKHIRLVWLHNWDSRICGICKKLIDGSFDVDHIVPLSKGGAHHADNMQLAHPFCNRSKHNKLL